MNTLEAAKEGLEALLRAVPAMEIQHLELQWSLRDADKRLEAVRSECAAAIEHHAALQLAQAAEDREARDAQVLQIERDRILGLIRLQLERLNERGINARALKALRKMIIEDAKASDLERRLRNVQP